MISLDTNVILRFLLRDILDQAKKAENLVKNSPCYVTDVVLTETVFVMEKIYETPRQGLVALLRGFLTFPNLTYNTYLMDDVLDMFEKYHSLSIIDCYSAVEAKVFGNQLVTFDKKLMKQGGSHIVVA